MEARGSTHLSKITLSIIKSAHEFNYFGSRSALINTNKIKESCLRCAADETWEHVTKCVKITVHREDFIMDLVKELLVVKQNKVSVTKIFDMLENILNFREDDDIDKYEKISI